MSFHATPNSVIPWVTGYKVTMYVADLDDLYVIKDGPSRGHCSYVRASDAAALTGVNPAASSRRAARRGRVLVQANATT